MGDMGDFWRDVKPEMKRRSSEKRMSNLEFAHKHFAEKGIAYVDKGYHFIVSHNGKTADFWPTTGKWNVRGGKKYGRGIMKLIKSMESSVK